MPVVVGIPREIPHDVILFTTNSLKMALSKFEGALLACNSPSDDALAARVKAHHTEFLSYLNPLQLMPHLWKERLLTDSDREELLSDHSRSQKAHRVLQSLKSSGQNAYSRFLRCLNAEKHHTGHVYLTSLLENGSVAPDIAMCAQFEEIVIDHLPDLMDLDVSSLAPKLLSHRLLTPDEFTDLNNCSMCRQKILQLLHTISTKGPQAYRIFVDCLEEEKSHPTHRYLFELLSSELKSHQVTSQKWGSAVDCSRLPPSKRSPHRLKLEGPLTGQSYNKLMSFFQTCHHNGQWELLEHKAKQLISGEIPDLKVVALLESAVSWIFRRDKDKVLSLVSDARKVCCKLSANNDKFLKGRCEYILSRLFRYLKDYDEAKVHIAKAKDLLFLAEPGEDTSFVNYCEACIRVECLPVSPSQGEIQEVETTFKFAIDDDFSHETELRLVAPHSFIRLAQMCLGSTHYNPGVTSDPPSIHKAQKYLQAVDRSSLCYRSKCHYHIFESDLCRSGNDITSATEAANTALMLARRHSFALEICSAETRLHELGVY